MERREYFCFDLVDWPSLEVTSLNAYCRCLGAPCLEHGYLSHRAVYIGLRRSSW